MKRPWLSILETSGCLSFYSMLHLVHLILLQFCYISFLFSIYTMYSTTHVLSLFVSLPSNVLLADAKKRTVGQRTTTFSPHTDRALHLNDCIAFNEIVQIQIEKHSMLVTNQSSHDEHVRNCLKMSACMSHQCYHCQKESIVTTSLEIRSV